MKKTKITYYIVNYDDPDRPSEGVTKTRIFRSREEAKAHVDMLGPEIRNIKAVKQVSRMTNEEIQL